MLSNNVVNVFLWRLLLSFLFLWLGFFAKNLSVISCSIFALLLQLLVNELIHFSLLCLLRIILGLALFEIFLPLLLRLFLLQFRGFQTFILLFLLLKLFHGLRCLFLDVSHVLCDCHFLWVLAFTTR